MDEMQLKLESGSVGRSIGFQLLVICGLAVLMTIPALFVSTLVNDRASRAADVTNEVSRSVGGPQTFLGPTLAIPYEIPKQSATQPVLHGTYLIFPAKALASLQTVTTERHRSLFSVPIFRAALKLDSAFDLRGVPSALPQNANLNWRQAELVVGVSDARGAVNDGSLLTNGKLVNLLPAEFANDISFGSEERERIKLTLLGVPAGDIARPDASFHSTASLDFTGAQRIAVLPYGKSTQFVARGDWRNPGFDGGILPVSRSVSDRGFSAQWSVPFIARGVRAEGTLNALCPLSSTTLGISFIEVADAYQSVNRSLKYVLLIVGLIFLAYFVFEVATGKRVHAAQYVLLGVAQMIFYLLLLATAERVGFDFGFLLAAIASTTLLSLNAGWIFAGREQMVRAFIAFSLLYAFIYLLLRLQDNALLLGSISSFLAVAAVMYFTRGLDWYRGQAVSKASLRSVLIEHRAEPSGNA